MTERPEHHHTDLNVMHSIVALCEGGLLYTASGRAAASKIITICQAEAQRQLRAYDVARQRDQPLGQENQ